MSGVDRRRFLLRLMGVLLGAAFSRPSGAPAPGWTTWVDGEAARAIALAYLRAQPAEADRSRIEAELRRRLGAAAASVSRSTLRRKIAEDFSRGDTVRVGGWVLSRLECRVCVLAAYAGEEQPLL